MNLPPAWDASVATTVDVSALADAIASTTSLAATLFELYVVTGASGLALASMWGQLPG